MEQDTQNHFNTLDNLLPLYKINSGCDYHRIVLPLGYAGYDFTSLQDMTTEKLRKYKTIIFNRVPINIPLKPLLKLKEEYGVKVIADIDDYWHLYPSHYLYSHWKREGVSEKIQEFIRIADLVTTTTDRLVGKIKEINSNVHVVPNALPFNTNDQFLYNKVNSNEIRFGFVGGSSHLHDVKTIAPIFQFYNNINFTYCGYSKKSPDSVKMSKIFSNYNTNRNYKNVEMAGLDSYMYGYDTLDCCIAPLVKVEFNKYKSNLKVLEAGLKKCSIICSNVECYTDTVPDTVVTYCNSIKDWKEAIRKHRDIDYTKERGENLYNWVKENYSLEEVNKKRLKLIEGLWIK